MKRFILIFILVIVTKYVYCQTETDWDDWSAKVDEQLEDKNINEYLIFYLNNEYLDIENNIVIRKLFISWPLRISKSLTDHLLNIRFYDSLRVSFFRAIKLRSRYASSYKVEYFSRNPNFERLGSSSGESDVWSHFNSKIYEDYDSIKLHFKNQGYEIIETSFNSDNCREIINIISLELTALNEKRNKEKEKRKEKKFIKSATSEQLAAYATIKGLSAIGTIAGGGITSNKSDNFYSGKGNHIGINLGIVSPNIPVISNAQFTGNTVNGNNYSYVKSPAQIGLLGGMVYHPLIGDFFSLGVEASANYNFSFAALVGGLSSKSSSNTNISASTNISSFNYKGGISIAAGARKLKLLVSGYYLGYQISYQYESSSYISTVSTSITEEGSSSYHALRGEAGLRLFAYDDYILDLVGGIEQFKDFNSEIKRNIIYKISFWLPSYFKFFAEYSFATAYGQNEYKWKDGNDAKKGSMISIGLIYCKDWFK